MKALISTIEPVQTGFRVAQVVNDSDVFDVAPGLFWVTCSDEVQADRYWFDDIDQSIKKIPEVERPTVVNQPISQGAQTL
jgi:hypothetical protein